MAMDRAATLTSLDSELAILEQGLTTARRRRNLKTAVQQLPAEVLTMIFAEAQVAWLPRRQYVSVSDAAPKVQYDFGWMYLLHVCSLWTEVIRNTPSLWCEVHCVGLHPRFMLRVLSLSNGLDLSLTIDARPPITENNVIQLIDTWLCGPVLHRTRRLNLLHFSQELLDTCLPYLDFPLPALTDFTLDSLDEAETEWPDFLPTELFAGRCPRLSSIHVMNRILPWNSPLLSHRMRHLKVGFGDVSELQNAMPTMFQFLDLLESMPVLESLSLARIVPISMLSMDDARQVILPGTFKRLVVSIHVYVPHSLDLFRHLGIAADVTVAVEVPDADLLTRDDSISLSADIEHIFLPPGNLDSGAYHELNLNGTLLSLCYHPRDIRSMWTRGLHPPYPSTTFQTHTFSRGRHVYLEHDESDDGAIMLVHLSHLPLQAVRCCTFNARFMRLQLHAVEWHVHFSVASETRRISLAYSDGRRLFEALADAREGHGGEHPGGLILFPKLEVIVLHASLPMGETEAAVIEGADLAPLDIVLFELVRVRRSWQMQLKEILVSQALASRTDLWQRLESMVTVNFF
ncbi:unnamed protein product [Peniophora sp. CBMAI 1063]|nr:unnamed protein product [Peniophora sp. CBMAI 1063]